MFHPPIFLFTFAAPPRWRDELGLVASRLHFLPFCGAPSHAGKKQNKSTSPLLPASYNPCPPALLFYLDRPLGTNC